MRGAHRSSRCPLASLALRGVQEVAVTDHAVARYRERVKPGLSLGDAEAELLHVLPFARLEAEMPGWHVAPLEQPVAAWAMLGDGIAFPLVHGSQPGVLVAVTCLTHGCRSEEALVVRRERKARRRAARHQNVDGIRGSRRRREAAA
jgi:hypothetical protein